MLVEQNLAATLALADRAYIIDNDHIVYERPAQEIKARPEILHRHLGVCPLIPGAARTSGDCRYCHHEQ